MHGFLIYYVSVRCKDGAKAKRDKTMMYDKGGESRQQALEQNDESDDSTEDDASEDGTLGAAESSRRSC